MIHYYIIHYIKNKVDWKNLATGFSLVISIKWSVFIYNKVDLSSGKESQIWNSYWSLEKTNFE